MNHPTLKRLIETNKKLNEQEKEEILQFVLKSLNNTSNLNLYVNDDDFGHYLAGLCEGDGHFSKKGLEICFHEKDLATAEWLKERIGYGNIYKDKNRQSYSFWIYKWEGISKVLNLVNGKFLTENKINQISSQGYLLKHDIKLLPNMDSKQILNSAFLSGFTDADGSFIIDAKNSIALKFSQKDLTILNHLKNNLGGNYSLVKDSKTQLNYGRYTTSSYEVAKKAITYFNSFPLMSTKFIEIQYWISCYELAMKKEHKTLEGKIKTALFRETLKKIRSWPVLKL